MKHSGHNLPSAVEVTLWLVLVFTFVDGRKQIPEGRCTFFKNFKTGKMMTADCANKNLKSIPSYLNEKVEVEILDAYNNKIRELKNDTFITFTSLKRLYLSDNAIATIEPMAFEPVIHLELLDLSLNSLKTFPPRLPAALRRLYLSQNPNEGGHLQGAMYLEIISLSESKLTQFPELGNLHFLQEMNLTENPIQSLRREQFASHCALTTLFLPHSLSQSQAYLESCDCFHFTRWMYDHNVQIVPFINCTITNLTECPANNTEIEEVYEQCMSVHRQHAVKHWLTVGGIIGLVICILLLMLLWYTRCKRRPLPKTRDIEDKTSKHFLKSSRSSSSAVKF